MNADIKILHPRRLVGEAIAWSLQFAYAYSATYLHDQEELQQALPDSTVVLTDVTFFWKLSEVGRILGRPVIVLLEDIESGQVVDLLKAGATTIIDLSRGPEQMIETVEKVLNFSVDDQHVIIQKLLQHQNHGSISPDGKTYNLTAKETEILKLLRDGVHPKMIAKHTGTTYETVRTHIKHIYKKLGVMSAAEAVIKALKINL